MFVNIRRRHCHTG